MDKLKITIDPVEDNPTCSGVYFSVNAFVNGDALGEWLDVDEFVQSLAPVGDLAAAYNRVTKTRKQITPITKRLPIFNCSCGAFGCGGYSVDVTVTRESLVWESDFVHRSQRGAANRRRFEFSWDNVRVVAGELIAAIYDAIPRSESREVGSAVLSSNLAERLPFYLALYDALGADGSGRLDIGSKHNAS